MLVFDSSFSVLIVDDDPTLAHALSGMLHTLGLRTQAAYSGKEALELVRAGSYDLVISDIRMPEMDGFELCIKLKDLSKDDYLPVVLVTGHDSDSEKVHGLEVGADDFLQKPFNQSELIARLKSLLRIRSLQRETKKQARLLVERNDDLKLEIGKQVAQLNRLERLKKFFSPTMAELIIADGIDNPLKSHRKHVSVLFVDLRGFTSFSETAEPEEVMSVLDQYYSTVGKIALQYRGTLGHLAGDGMMVFFNDPVDIPNHTQQAVLMALEARKALDIARDSWQKRGHTLNYGIGLAEGFATIGEFGFNEFWDYSVIGSVTNMAARLCSEANSGEILISHRYYRQVDTMANVEFRAEFTLKGFHRKVSAYNVVSLKENELEKIA